jgi:site-specific DNA-cytosine methylase
LENSGLVESKWAVEIDQQASAAFQKNFPLCKVYNDDVSLWARKLKVCGNHCVVG